MFAANPFEHVQDIDHLGIFENLGLVWQLPWGLTKFKVLLLVAAGLILLIYWSLANKAQSGAPPSGKLWNIFESLLTFIRDQVARPYIGHDADRYVPFLWTQFLFILFCNLLGMIPFLGSPTASFSVTLTLAVITFFFIHGSAVAKMGVAGYAHSFIPHLDMPGATKYLILLLLVPIEIFGAFIKAFVLAVRLFANMLGGHTVLAVLLMFIVMVKNQGAFLFWPITFLSVAGMTALSLLELFVAFLQAFIFTFLTALFLGSALHPEH